MTSFNEQGLPATVVRRATQVDERLVDGLSTILLDCVAGGASVGFMAPLSIETARTFWRRVATDVANGDRALLVAEDDQGPVGTVQLVVAQPQNQPHRADLAKMLVHRRARRRGLGAALMLAAEDLARDFGKSLLVLDTVTGGDAERLYTRLGWMRCGVVPRFALFPDGRYCDTTFFFRTID